MLNWLPLTEISQLDGIVSHSLDDATPLICIFKHSTRCSISNMVKSRLERTWSDEITTPVYYLDLLKHRAISDDIVRRFNVIHESPQLLLIKNGECVSHTSHHGINTDFIAASKI